MQDSEVLPPPIPVLRAPWSVRAVRNTAGDIALVHEWMNRRHLAETWGQDWSLDRWTEEIRAQLSGDHSRPCLVLRDDRPMVYVEIYRPVLDGLAAYYSARPTDLGMHTAIGSVTDIGRGIGSYLLAVIPDALFAADPSCTMIVAEPRSTNVCAIRAKQRAGWTSTGQIQLPHKVATLMVRHRADRPEPVSAPRR